MDARGLSPKDIVADTEINVTQLSLFLRSHAKMKTDKLLVIAQKLGANGWGELYRTGGVPVERPDNGIGTLLRSIVTATIPVSGSLDDRMHIPIQQLLTHSTYAGDLLPVN